jgi:superfamily I DNA/RNA helicase
VIDQLRNMIDSFLERKSLEDLTNTEILENFIETVTLETDASKEIEEGQSGANNMVRLMTIHASKGLEFNRVFLVGCNEGIIPLNKAALEEERRLMYVGMTRAKQKLYLSSWIDQRGPRSYEPSRFVEERRSEDKEDKKKRKKPGGDSTRVTEWAYRSAKSDYRIDYRKVGR